MRDQIPRIDAKLLAAGDAETLEAVRFGATETGFLTLHNTAISADRVGAVLDSYRQFFLQPEALKRPYDMAATGANRGWGGPRAEQVDPNANPDLKEVFDCGFELAADDPIAALGLRSYAPNLWPDTPAGFAGDIRAYYAEAAGVALTMLQGLAQAIGRDPHHFDADFARPMALLRGNYYPPRPDWAGEKDFGIAAHTDYGCLTLLATDGSPGLEVETRDGAWWPVTVPPGTFVINFGEMMELWTYGLVRATPHRVKGGASERLSIPMFFNPAHDTNVAPSGSGEVIRAVDHLQKRFDETYVHLQNQGTTG